MREGANGDSSDVSAATMPENTQTGSVAPVNFDNLVLKRWLHSIGQDRRCKVLKKLKADLQNLGLSRKQVHRGLIQLSTKPRVFLTRQPLYERYGSKNLKEGIEEGGSRIDESGSPQQGNENVQRPDTPEMLLEENNKRNERADIIKRCKAIAGDNGRITSKTCKLDNPPGMLHSYDKALKLFVKRTSSKMNVHEKLSSKRTATISANTTSKLQSNHVALSEKSDTSENRINCIENKSAQIRQGTPDLVSDKIGADTVQTHQNKKIHLKLNLNSCCNKKRNDCAKSDVYRKVETDSAKSCADTELRSDSNVVQDVKVDPIPSKNGCSNCEDNGNVLSNSEEKKYKCSNCENSGNISSGTGKKRIEEVHKRKLQEPITSDPAQRRKISESIDECKKTNRRKRKKLKKKFRTYFGDCISISEDEQEQSIVKQRFKRRRNKNSVDSCDSGVYFAEGTYQRELPEIDVDSSGKSIEEETLSKYDEQNNNIDSNDIQVPLDAGNKDVEFSPVKETDQVPLNAENKDVEFSPIKEVHDSSRNEDEAPAQELEISKITEKEDIESSPIKEVHDSSCNKDGAPAQELEVSKITEKEDIQLNEVSQSRLRVLSSAELGSRWCPTPINIVTSTAPELSITTATTVSEVPLNCTTSTPILLTQTVPVTMSVITTSIPTVTVETTRSENKRSSIDLSFAEYVYVTFVNISNLIKSIRLPSVISFNYNKLLYMEFEKLRKILNTDNYVELTEAVICMLNTRLSVIPMVTLEELFRYTSSVKSLYDHCSQRLRTAVNNSNDCQTMIPTVVLDQMRSNQDACCNSQTSAYEQNMYNISSLQSMLQHLLSVPPKRSESTMNTTFKQPQNFQGDIILQSQCQTSVNVASKEPQQNLQEKVVLQSQNQIPINAASKQVKQNFQEKVALQSQCSHNSAQNSTLSSSVVTNSNATQQQQYNLKMSKGQRTFVQQKIQNSYFVKPVSNMHSTQSLPSQHSMFSVNSINQQARRHLPGPVLNAPFVNQQYAAQNMFMPQVNTLYNVSNHSVQKTINSMDTNMPNLMLHPVTQQYQHIYRQPIHNMSQGIQLQTAPQHVPSSDYIPKPVQVMFPVNVPYSVPKSTQQKEQTHKKVSSKVLMNSSNHVPEQFISSQYIQNTCPTKLKQSRSMAQKRQNSQVSLESMTKWFDILKYLSHIQKLILLQQIDFYFGCTTWLQQQFTANQWQKINLQRSLLLNFQTLLKHLIEKTINEILQNESQGKTAERNILTHIRIEAPKVVQIIVKENEEIRCQVEVSKADQQTANVDQNCTTCEENLNVIITQNQFGKAHEATDSLQNKKLLAEAQETEVSNKKEVQKDKTLEMTVQLPKSNSPVKPALENEISTIDTKKKHEVGKESGNSKNIHTSDIKEKGLKELQEVERNISQISEEKSTVALDMQLPSKDTLCQTSPHLVTVEISSNNDQVTVINTNVDENKSTNKELQEHEVIQEELHHTNKLFVENASCTVSTSSPETLDNIECFDNIDNNKCSLKDTSTSYIADVRSISLEAFEKLENVNNVANNITEGNIEEEEIKVCLFCGRPSIVACSICLEAKYCSKKCSELHWEVHYKDCTPVERSVYL
ncbi:unnamed protein product [Xylocopa violacea]|uniref:MYND-type domain-containing protein n=1 Tax=Xylocopa violacea TaxID=135666 RepID=A0ABP1P2D7_XYLVO